MSDIQEAALSACAASLLLFYLLGRPQTFPTARQRVYLFYILVLGLLVRLVLAWKTTGNYDRESWEIVSKIASSGGNVYAETFRYNSSPVWSWVLGALRPLAKASSLPLKVFFCGFLTLVDLATACLLYTLREKDAPDRLRTTAFFFLNPVSFLLTGYHGQFDNFALFFLVLALWGAGRFRGAWAWLWTTAGFITKHIIFYELFIVLSATVKRFWVRAVLFIASCFFFAATFLPYWKEGKEGILKNVILYSSYSLPYGLSAFGPVKALKVAFIASLFVYPFFIRRRELWTRALLGTLFFLTFTTGVGTQYFILPIALGAVRPSKGFFIYTFVTTCFLLGSYFNMGIKFMSWVPLQSVWLAVSFWWVSVHSQSAETA